MVARTPPGPATQADIDALPEHVVGEIIDGQLIVSPRPAPPHANASSTLGMDLNPFHRKSGGPHGPGGWWILFEPELHLGPHALVPDLAGWHRERMPHMPETAWFGLAPDWVCEVTSPATARSDRMKKMRIYGENGVPWLWLVDPLAKIVEVFRRDGEHWVLQDVRGGDDPEARLPPFDAVAIDLARWWEGGPPEPEAGVSDVG